MVDRSPNTPIYDGDPISVNQDVHRSLRRKGWNRIYHGPIEFLQAGLAVECDVDSRNERPNGLDNDGHIIQAAPEIRISLRMAEKGVIGG